MKSVIVLALCAGVCLAQYTYVVPPTPCEWNVVRETKTAYSYEKTKIFVNGAFQKREFYDKKGDMISASVNRADYATKSDIAVFTFDGLSCSVKYSSKSSMNYAGVIGFGSYYSVFDNIEETEYDGTDCMVYYNNNETTGEPDINASAYYVKDNGFVIAHVEHADDPERKVVVTYDWGKHSPMSVFTFSKGNVYACSDDRIFHNPSSDYVLCAASTSTAVVSLVFAAIVACLLSLF